jgi:hypothetical protein
VTDAERLEIVPGIRAIDLTQGLEIKDLRNLIQMLEENVGDL